MQLNNVLTWLFVVLLWLIGLGMLGWGLWSSHATRRERFAGTRLRHRLMKWNVITPAEEGTTLTDELVRNWTRENAHRLIGEGFGWLVPTTLAGGVLYVYRGTPIGTSQDMWTPILGIALIGGILGVTLAAHRRRADDWLSPRSNISSATMSRGRPKIVLLIAVGILLLYGASTLLVTIGAAGSYPGAWFYRDSGLLDPRIYPWTLWSVPITCAVVFFVSEVAIQVVSRQALPRLSSDDGMSRRAAQKLLDIRLASLATGEAFMVPILAMQQNLALQFTHLGALDLLSIALTLVAVFGMLVGILQIQPIMDAPVQILPGETA